MRLSEIPAVKYQNTNLMKINDEIWLDEDEFSHTGNRVQILEKFDLKEGNSRRISLMTNESLAGTNFTNEVIWSQSSPFIMKQDTLGSIIGIH